MKSTIKGGLCMTDRYRNIEIAKENKEIVKQNRYEYYDEDSRGDFTGDD